MDQHDHIPPPTRRDAHLRHTRHHIAVAEQAERHYLAGGNGVTAGLALFDHMRAQLDLARRRLQGYARDQEIDELLLAEASATMHIGDLRYAKQTERIPQLEQALQAAQRRENQAAQGRCLNNLGLAYADLGDARQALMFHQQALDVARATGDSEGEAHALGNLGLAHAALGDTRQALDFHQQALALARAISDRRGEAVALNNLGQVYFALGDARQAIEYYQQTLALARTIGDPRYEATSLGNLGNAYFALGEARQAIDFHQQHLALVRAIGDQRGEAAALGNLGNASFGLGDARQSIEFHQQQLALARTIGDQRGEAAALGNLGSAYYALGDARQALVFHQQDLDLARATGNRRGEAGALGNLGNAYLLLGNAYQAINFHRQHLALARSMDDQRGEAAALGNLGLVYETLDDAHRAIKFYQQSLALARATGDRDGEAHALGNLGNAYYALDDFHQAIDFHQQNLRLARATGDRRGEAAALGNLGNAYLVLGHTVQGLDCHQQHLTLAHAIGDRQGQATASWNYGLALVEQGESAQALPLLEAGLAFFQQISHPRAVSMANNLAYIRAHGPLPREPGTSVTPGDLPLAVQDALDSRSTQQIMAGLPPELRTALEQGDQAGLEAVLAALPEPQRQHAMVDLDVLQSRATLAAQQEQQRQQLAVLMRVIANVAAGDDRPRQVVEAELAALEQGGWMLREPVARLWAGERDRDTLVAGLDEQETRLIERALELTVAYERSELRTPAQVLADLPEAVRIALENDDEAAINTAIAALDAAEQVRVAALLAELSSETEQVPESPAVVPNEPVVPPAWPDPDIDPVIQQFLPLLGDIALGALGDETARQIAEAVLAGLEESGWQIGAAARRIWAGERDLAALTEGLDAQDSALIQRALRLIIGGRSLIGVAFSRQMDRIRQLADDAFAQAGTASPQEREVLAADLQTTAGQAEERPGAAWQNLAAHLRSLATQLRAM